MSLVYIVFGRFERLSFDRQERYVRPLAERITAITEKLDEEIAKYLTKVKQERRMKNELSSITKVSLFSVSAVFITMGVALSLFLSVIRKLFFNLLIGWKSLGLGSLRVMFSKFVDLVGQLTGVFNIPIDVIGYCLYPLTLICDLADLFDVNGFYDLLTVTCEGAKAPIELFIDSFVLGVAILFINSDYNFLWAMTLQEMNKSLVVKYWVEGNKLVSMTFVLSSMALILTITNPFITFLRFILSFVNFGSFFVNNHVTHFLSEACVGIEGFQNQELLLVFATSVLVWWLIPAMLYMISEIVCPKGGYTESRSLLPFTCGNPDSYSVTPLLSEHPGADIDNNDSGVYDNDESSLGSVFVSEFDASSVGSVFISEYDNNSYGRSSRLANGDVSEYEGNSNSSIGSVVVSRESEVEHKSNNSDNRSLSSFFVSEFSEDDNYLSITSGSALGMMPTVLRISTAGQVRDSSTATLGSVNISEYTSSSIGSVVVSEESEVEHKSNNSDNGSLSSVFVSEFSDDDSFLATFLPPSAPGQVRDVSTADSSCLVMMGVLRYLWSYIRSAMSADLLLVYSIDAWISYCRKALSLEQLRKLRAHHRWNPQVIGQSITEFRKRLKTMKLKRYTRFFTQYESSARESSAEFEQKWKNRVQQSNLTKLPPYYRLCCNVQQELHRKFMAMNFFWQLSIPISYVIAFSGYGHVLSIIGREKWEIVVRKFTIFGCACIGYWTDEIYEAYIIAELVKAFTILDPIEATILFIPLTIAARAILLQALGDTATLISIVIINLCSCPLFVFSPKMLKNIPPLLYLNAREVAIEREKIELLGRNYVDRDDGSIQLDEWVVRMRTVSIFLTESRLMLFFFNLVSVFLTIILLKGFSLSANSLALILFAMLPYSIGSSLISIMYVGKRLNLTDHDFRVVFVDWCIPIRDGLGAELERAGHAMAVRIAAVTLYSTVFVNRVRNCMQPQQRVHEIVDEESVEPSGFVDIIPDDFLFESPTTLPLDCLSPATLTFSLNDVSENISISSGNYIPSDSSSNRSQHELRVRNSIMLLSGQGSGSGSDVDSIHITVDNEEERGSIGQDSQTHYCSLQGSEEHEVEDQGNGSIADTGSVDLSAGCEDYEVDEGSILLTGMDCGIDHDGMYASEDLCEKDSSLDIGSFSVPEVGQDSRTDIGSIFISEEYEGDPEILLLDDQDDTTAYDEEVESSHSEEEEKETAAERMNDDDAVAIGSVDVSEESEVDERVNGLFYEQNTTTDSGRLLLWEENEQVVMLNSHQGSVFEFFSRNRAAHDAVEGSEKEEEEIKGAVSEEH